MTPWNPEAVLALAPDPGSAKSAQGLASARQWQTLGQDDISLWGEIVGSGSKPYQARIDLREPAFKCSCPSRKFPCKHGLALLLVFAGDAAAFKRDTPPAWVTDWLASREQRGEKKAEKASAEAADPKAQEKRAGKREARVDGGLEQLAVWLGDLMRLGLAHAQAQPAGFWEAMSARLVDAQAPGLARLVRQLEDAVHSGPGWEGRLMHGVARLELIRAAYGNRARIDAPLAEEARASVGFTRTLDDLAAEPGVRDDWRVAGVVLESEERLKVRRTWLFGTKSRRPALLLDFAVGSQPLEPALQLGSEIDAELAFYPAGMPLRAVVREKHGAAKPGTGALAGDATIEAALQRYAQALGASPWLERWPMALSGVHVVVEPRAEGHPAASLADATGARILLPPRFAQAWHLLAVAGGHPVDVFGEWDGEFIKPLSIASPGGRYAVGEGLVRMRQAA